MKRFILGLILFFLSTTGFTNVKTIIILNITGINCEYCLYKMQNKLSDLDGIENVMINKNNVRLIAKVTNVPNLLTIKKIIYNSGYTPGKTIISHTED